MTRLACSVVLFGFLLSSAGCGEPGFVCGPDTCSGCCLDNRCVGGTSEQACGRGGQRCDTCISTQACMLGDCVVRLPGGSGGGAACIPEPDAVFCARSSRACGPASGVDNCGTTRSVATCGTCGVASSCSALGTCVCSPETDAQLCARAGRTCGALTVTDSCGQLRSISSCGTCTSGSSCSTQGRCVCTPETDAQLCARLGWACGPLTATDTCGASRVVSSCGSCAPGNACSGGVCACASETDASFCARRSAACGSVSGVDGCGNPRSVATCGSCSGHQTCGGGGLSNQCGCTAESDAALCARLSKDCGSLTAMDTCGLTRTVPSCGTCSGPQTCGGGGTPNVCACLAETDAQFCARHGNSCGSVTATDTCGATRTVASCSTCPGAPNGTPACVNGSCTVACNTGYQACATGCCPRVTETIDVSTSWFRSGGFAVQPDGTAHVIYWRQQPSTGLGEVRYGRKVNGVWALTTLRTGATSADPGGIAVEPGGRVHLVSGSQYWVSATGGGFAPPESFDASPASLPVMALSQSTVHVAYRAAAQVGGTWRSEVRYTERSATGWSQPMVLGTDISVDDRINVAVAASGDVLVSFRASNAVQVAVRSGGSWSTQSLAANTGNYSTVVAQPRPGGGAWVSYHVGYGSTRVAESTTGPYATAFSFGGWARLADGATPEPILAGVTYVNLNTPGNLVLVRRINGAWQSETILANVADGTMAGDAFVDANGRVYVLAEGYQSLRLFY